MEAWLRGRRAAARANPHSLVCRPSLSLARDLAPCVVFPSVPQLPQLSWGCRPGVQASGHTSGRPWLSLIWQVDVID